MQEKYIVRVIRKRTTTVEENKEATAPLSRKIEETDQIFEQEFDKLDIGEFALNLNIKKGQEKDEKAIKL